MACIEIIILVTNSRDAASGALRELKRLNREGWIDLTCYALVDEDEECGPRVREISDRAETIGGTAAKGLAGGLMLVLAPVDGYAEASLGGDCGVILVRDTSGEVAVTGN